jgi:hypothetical protein
MCGSVQEWSPDFMYRSTVCVPHETFRDRDSKLVPKAKIMSSVNRTPAAVGLRPKTSDNFVKTIESRMPTARTVSSTSSLKSFFMYFTVWHPFLFEQVDEDKRSEEKKGSDDEDEDILVPPGDADAFPGPEDTE